MITKSWMVCVALGAWCALLAGVAAEPGVTLRLVDADNLTAGLVADRLHTVQWDHKGFTDPAGVMVQLMIARSFTASSSNFNNYFFLQVLTRPLPLADGMAVVKPWASTITTHASDGGNPPLLVMKVLSATNAADQAAVDLFFKVPVSVTTQAYLDVSTNADEWSTGSIGTDSYYFKGVVHTSPPLVLNSGYNDSLLTIKWAGRNLATPPAATAKVKLSLWVRGKWLADVSPPGGVDFSKGATGLVWDATTMQGRNFTEMDPFPVVPRTSASVYVKAELLPPPSAAASSYPVVGYTDTFVLHSQRYVPGQVDPISRLAATGLKCTRNNGNGWGGGYPCVNFVATRRPESGMDDMTMIYRNNFPSPPSGGLGATPMGRHLFALGGSAPGIIYGDDRAAVDLQRSSFNFQGTSATSSSASAYFYASSTVFERMWGSNRSVFTPVFLGIAPYTQPYSLVAQHVSPLTLGWSTGPMLYRARQKPYVALSVHSGVYNSLAMIGGNVTVSVQIYGWQQLAAAWRRGAQGGPGASVPGAFSGHIYVAYTPGDSSSFDQDRYKDDIRYPVYRVPVAFRVAQRPLLTPRPTDPSAQVPTPDIIYSDQVSFRLDPNVVRPCRYYDRGGSTRYFTDGRDNSLYMFFKWDFDTAVSGARNAYPIEPTFNVSAPSEFGIGGMVAIDVEPYNPYRLSYDWELDVYLDVVPAASMGNAHAAAAVCDLFGNNTLVSVSTRVAFKQSRPLLHVPPCVSQGDYVLRARVGMAADGYTVWLPVKVVNPELKDVIMAPGLDLDFKYDFAQPQPAKLRRMGTTTVSVFARGFDAMFTGLVTEIKCVNDTTWHCADLLNNYQSPSGSGYDKCIMPFYPRPSAAAGTLYTRIAALGGRGYGVSSSAASSGVGCRVRVSAPSKVQSTEVSVPVAPAESAPFDVEFKPAITVFTQDPSTMQVRGVSDTFTTPTQFLRDTGAWEFGTDKPLLPGVKHNVLYGATGLDLFDTIQWYVVDLTASGWNATTQRVRGGGTSKLLSTTTDVRSFWRMYRGFKSCTPPFKGSYYSTNVMVFALTPQPSDSFFVEGHKYELQAWVQATDDSGVAVYSLPFRTTYELRQTVGVKATLFKDSALRPAGQGAVSLHPLAHATVHVTLDKLPWLACPNCVYDSISLQMYLFASGTDVSDTAQALAFKSVSAVDTIAAWDAFAASRKTDAAFPAQSSFQYGLPVGDIPAGSYLANVSLTYKGSASAANTITVSASGEVDVAARAGGFPAVEVATATANYTVCDFCDGMPWQFRIRAFGAVKGERLILSILPSQVGAYVRSDLQCAESVTDDNVLTVPATALSGWQELSCTWQPTTTSSMSSSGGRTFQLQAIVDGVNLRNGTSAPFTLRHTMVTVYDPVPGGKLFERSILTVNMSYSYRSAGSRTRHRVYLRQYSSEGGSITFNNQYINVYDPQYPDPSDTTPPFWVISSSMRPGRVTTLEITNDWSETAVVPLELVPRTGSLCPGGQWNANVSASGSLDCRPVTDCTAGVTYQAYPATWHHDRVCWPVKPCPDGRFRSNPPTASQPGTCSPVRPVCDTSSGLVEAAAPTASSDRVCKRADGTAASRISKNPDSAWYVRRHTSYNYVYVYVYLMRKATGPGDLFSPSWDTVTVTDADTGVILATRTVVMCSFGSLTIMECDTGTTVSLTSTLARGSDLKRVAVSVKSRTPSASYSQEDWVAPGTSQVFDVPPPYGTPTISFISPGTGAVFAAPASAATIDIPVRVHTEFMGLHVDANSAPFSQPLSWSLLKDGDASGTVYDSGTASITRNSLRFSAKVQRVVDLLEGQFFIQLRVTPASPYLRSYDMSTKTAKSGLFRFDADFVPPSLTVAFKAGTAPTQVFAGDSLELLLTASRGVPAAGATSRIKVDVILEEPDTGVFVSTLHTVDLTAPAQGVYTAATVQAVVPERTRISLDSGGRWSPVYNVVARLTAPTGILRVPLASSLKVLSSFSWATTAWGKCDAECGSGSQTRTVSCKRAGQDFFSDAVLCAHSGPEPARRQSCFDKPCADFGWKVSDWGACSASCGGGQQSRSVVCVDATGTQVSADKCTATRPSASRACNRQTCETFNWAYGDWSDCEAECKASGYNTGVRTRQVVCRGGVTSRIDQTGELCSASRPTGTWGTCSMYCSTRSWKVGAWEKCDKPCGIGSTTRTIQCWDNTQGKAVASAQCGGTPPAAQRPCNVQQCIDTLAAWVPDDFGDCKAKTIPSTTPGGTPTVIGTDPKDPTTCGIGEMARAVDCRNAASGEVITGGGPCSSQPMPATSVPCKLADVTCDACAAVNCKNGNCTAGFCTCETGWTGAFCDVQTVKCSSGVVTADGTCCESGFVDRYGNCCIKGQATGRAYVDKNGFCCKNYVNGCGECLPEESNEGRYGFLDAAGKCCRGVPATKGDTAVGVLDAQGLCCKGELDSCGVCGGDDTTCKLHFVGQVTYISEAPATELATAGTLANAQVVQRAKAAFAQWLSVDPLLLAVDEVSTSSVAPAPRLLAADPSGATKEHARLAARDPSVVVDLGDIVAGGEADETEPAAVDDEAGESGARRLATSTNLYVAFTLTPESDPDKSGWDGPRVVTQLYELASTDVQHPNNVTFTTFRGSVTSGVCGNSVCEYGEACTAGATACCAVDCPVGTMSCPSPPGTSAACGGGSYTTSSLTSRWKGACIATTGVCLCNEGMGYTGVDCSQCLSPFVPGPSYTCVLSPVLTALEQEKRQSSQPSGSGSGGGGSGSGSGAGQQTVGGEPGGGVSGGGVAGIVIGILALGGCVAGAVWVVRDSRSGGTGMARLKSATTRQRKQTVDIGALNREMEAGGLAMKTNPLAAAVAQAEARHAVGAGGAAGNGARPSAPVFSETPPASTAAPAGVSAVV